MAGWWESLRTYIAECARILYCAYFKPYTFRRWLREIDPDLDVFENPFRFRARFPDNPRLRRYGGQAWWLTAVVPLLVVILTGMAYSLASSSEPFRWSWSFCFLVGWWTGLWAAQYLIMGKRIVRLLVILVILSSFFVALFLLLILLLVGQKSLITGMALGVAFGMAFGIACGVTISMAFGVVVGVAFGVACGVAFGTASSVVFGTVSGMAFSVMGGVAFGVAVGMASGVAIGMMSGIAGRVAVSIVLGVAGGVVSGAAFGATFGVAVGMALGVAWVLGTFRVCFWLLELVWTFALALLARPGQYARWLRYLPPRFDELIFLPLPFLDKFIARAYWENQAAARQMIDYLITSTNQQRLAARAITEIAADSLRRCGSTEDIAAVAGQLEWIPQPPPKPLGPFLPRFVEIAQGVRAAQEEESFYRRAELMRRPVQRLRQLRESLATESPRFATVYGEITDRWLRILEPALRTLEEQARSSPEIPQVYIAGPPLDPETAGERFKGREDIFREIGTLVLSEVKPIILLYGGRRTGKTSVLKHLRLRVGPEILPLFVDVQGLTAITLKGLAEYLAKEIVESARRARHFRLPHPDPRALAGDPFIALQKWMDEVEKITGDRTLLLCLDEYERLEEVVRETGSRMPLNFLRHVMQHRRQWVLLFSGSHMLDELAPYWSDYLINTRTVRVSYLREEYARELIRRPVRDFPDIYEDETVEAIVRLTRCQPFLVQLTCYELVERLNRQKRWRATPEDVEAVIPEVFEKGYNFFAEFWSSLTSEQREVLSAVVRGEEVPEALQPAARRLVQKEVLEPVGGTYRFQVPLMQRWVEEKIRH